MLNLVLSPSRLLLAMQYLLHGLALLAIFISSLVLHWKLVAAVLTFASAGQAIRHAKLKSPKSVLCLEIEYDRSPGGHRQGGKMLDDSCIIVVFPDRRLPVSMTWCYCLAWVQVLAFKHQRRTYIAVVLPDSIGSPQRRELRAYLRSSSCLRDSGRCKDSISGNL